MRVIEETNCKLSVSNGNVNVLRTYKMKSICNLRCILLLALLVAKKRFQIVFCRIGLQLTSDEI